MITRISSGSSPAGAVFYNEQKVGKGEADRLAIRNFEGVRVSTQHLTPVMVAEKLENRAALNERIKLPTFHVSLALAKGEKLAAPDLIAIADEYMQGMGYGRQPYAVYQHNDTEHPHIHIVSVRIDEGGKKISDSYEREKSNTLRQQIEQSFGLRIAEDMSLRPQREELKPVLYGQGDLRADLSAVVQRVLKDFTFSSFSQFNQLLKIYNVQATEIPLEGQKPGLKYSAIDAEGNHLGTALKASSLAHRPTMDTVERRINAGKKIKGDRVGALRKSMADELAGSSNWQDFQAKLSQKGIELIPHIGKDNNLFGLSFLDTRQRMLYTGSELGKAYTAGSLKNQLGTYEPYTPAQQVTQEQKVGQSQNYSWAEDSWESMMRRIDAENFAREHPYRRPTEEEKLQQQEATKQWVKDNLDEFKQDHRPDQRVDDEVHSGLMRRLLHALNDNGSMYESEQDLKRMLKKSRKPRLS